MSEGKRGAQVGSKTVAGAGAGRVFTYPSGREEDAHCVRVIAALQFLGGADVRAAIVVRRHRGAHSIT